MRQKNHSRRREFVSTTWNGRSQFPNRKNLKEPRRIGSLGPGGRLNGDRGARLRTGSGKNRGTPNQPRCDLGDEQVGGDALFGRPSEARQASYQGRLSSPGARALQKKMRDLASHAPSPWEMSQRICLGLNSQVANPANHIIACTLVGLDCHYLDRIGSVVRAQNHIVAG
jgi:hypothetical protein